MKLPIFFILFCLLLTNSGFAQKRNSTVHVKKSNVQNWNSLKKYVGSYPKEDGFFKNPIVVNELKKILVSDYKSYTEHVSMSGCGETFSKDGFICGDVSQLHVGGYNSLFFIDVKNKQFYLFWLKGPVEEWDYKIYGPKPTPIPVLNLITENMNTGWGHVAKFSVEKDLIIMQKNN